MRNTTALIIEILLVGIITLCGVLVLMVPCIGELATMQLVSDVRNLTLVWWIVGPVLLSVAYVSGIVGNAIGRWLSRGCSRHAKLLALLSARTTSDRALIRRIGRLPEEWDVVLTTLSEYAGANSISARVNFERAWWSKFSKTDRKRLRDHSSQCFRHLRVRCFQLPGGSQMMNEQRSLLRVCRGAIFGLGLSTIGTAIVLWTWNDCSLGLASGVLALLSSFLFFTSIGAYVGRQLQADRYLVAFILDAQNSQPRKPIKKILARMTS